MHNIKLVLTTMAKGIAEAYAEIGPMSSFNLQDKIAAFVPIGTLIKETAEGLLAYSKLEEPIYDKDGKKWTRARAGRVIRRRHRHTRAPKQTRRG